MRVFDLGGSGVKTAKLSPTVDIATLQASDVVRYEDPDWADFPGWAKRSGLLDDRLIGISCAGLLDSDAKVRLFYAARWFNRPLKDEIVAQYPSRVFILNDAEAHLMAHTDLLDLPCMNITLGTSIGFALSDRSGGIVRPPDGMNFELGHLSIPSPGTQDKIWWSLGSNGLQELKNDLGEDEGTARFGSRLGSFIFSLCSIFRPSAVVLSGGIVESAWDKFAGPMMQEFEVARPFWIPSPRFHRSAFGDLAGLVGIGKYARRMAEDG